MHNIVTLEEVVTHYCAISQIVQGCFAESIVTVCCDAAFLFCFQQPLAYRAAMLPQSWHTLLMDNCTLIVRFR